MESTQDLPSGSGQAASNDLGLEIFAAEVNATWSALTSRFADRLSIAELDHLFAVFILGLTSHSFGWREPRDHLEACRSLLELKMSPERARVALHAVPEAKEPWVASAYETMERRGTEMGLAIIKQSGIEGASVADDGSNPSIAAEGKESCNE